MDGGSHAAGISPGQGYGVKPCGCRFRRAGSSRECPRTAESRLGTRKTMIVALARKLLIALWRFVTTGETLEGVILRPAG